MGVTVMIPNEFHVYTLSVCYGYAQKSHMVFPGVSHTILLSKIHKSPRHLGKLIGLMMIWDICKLSM